MRVGSFLRFILLLTVLCCIAFSSYVAHQKRDSLSSLAVRGMQVIALPVTNLAGYVRSLWIFAKGYARGIESLQKAYNQLYVEHLHLYAQYAVQAEQLKRATCFGGSSCLDQQAYAVARILSVQMRNADYLLLIDRGLKHKVGIGDLFFNEGTLIGIVQEVYDYSARVQVVFSPRSGVPVGDSNHRYQGILYGNVVKYVALMRFNKEISEPRKGDLIVTSGAGRLYPAGLAIGKVTEVVLHEPSNSWQLAIVPLIEVNDIVGGYLIKGLIPVGSGDEQA